MTGTGSSKKTSSLLTPEQEEALERMLGRCKRGPKIPKKIRQKHKQWARCLITRLKPVKSKGCVQVTCGLKKVTLSTLILHSTGIERGDLQASHLCGNSQCAEASHIILETSLDNNLRKNCRGYVLIPPFEVTSPTTGEKFMTSPRFHSACKHKPHCIIFDKQ